jgi:hypothetical protein
VSPILESIGSVKGFGWGALAAGGSFESIATTIVGAGGSSTITFSSIPADYTHLQLRAHIRNTASSGPRANGLQINGVTSNSYRWHYLLGNGATVSASSGTQVDTPYAFYFGESPSTNNLSNNFSPMIIDILDYTNTNKNKTLRCLTGFNANGYAPTGNTNNETGKVFFASGFLNSTNAITSLTFTPQGGNYAQYTKFALYGIKGA